MTKQAFDALLIIKLQDILSFLKEKNGSFIQSLVWLYQSNMYKLIIKEETKLWQMSTLYLYEMLEEEDDNNK